MNDAHSVLDADIIAMLTAAQRPVQAANAPAAQRIRTRLMKRIAAGSVPHHITVPQGAGEWHRFMPGIQRKVLHEQQGIMSYLLKFAPGAVLPAHRHPHDEECVVLEGRVRIAEIELGPGSFHMVHEGVLDADTTSDDGCLVYLRGASPDARHLL